MEIQWSTPELLVAAEAVALNIHNESSEKIVWSKISSVLRTKHLRDDPGELYDENCVQKQIESVLNGSSLSLDSINGVIKSLRARRVKELENVISTYDQRIDGLKQSVTSDNKVTDNAANDGDIGATPTPSPSRVVVTSSSGSDSVTAAFSDLPVAFPLLSRQNTNESQPFGEIYAPSRVSSIALNGANATVGAASTAFSPIPFPYPNTPAPPASPFVPQSTMSNTALTGTNESPPSKRQKVDVSKSDDVAVATAAAASAEKPVVTEKVSMESLLSAWAEVVAYHDSEPFLEPVTEAQAPGYSAVIEHPMDLSTIRSMIQSSQVTKVLELAKLFSQVFRNAMLYNSRNSPLYKLAITYDKWVVERLRERFPANARQLMPTPVPQKKGVAAQKRKAAAASPYSTSTSKSATKSRKTSRKSSATGSTRKRATSKRAASRKRTTPY